MSIEHIARLLTEDGPDVVRRPKYKQLEAEELQDQILGNATYYIKFTIAADIEKGEKPIQSYDYTGTPNYPGSPDKIDWEIVTIDEAEAYDQNGNQIQINLNDQTKQKITQALYNQIDDETILDNLQWN